MVRAKYKVHGRRRALSLACVRRHSRREASKQAGQHIELCRMVRSEDTRDLLPQPLREPVPRYRFILIHVFARLYMNVGEIIDIFPFNT
eukprot:COSAG05_NODE_10325_length_571_cov_1.150424_1_plen_89_part_00